MASFKEKCLEYFDTSDFYEILKVESTASEKQIKKAYHRLSLLVHPDRVENKHKEVATEKFKVLGKIHSVLQDKDKRKIYDDCGEFDEDSESSFNWMDYWRSMFKKIELKDIENYKNEYIGSDTELRDIKKSYVGSKGNMDVMLELIPFSNCEEEPRYIEIVRKMVDDGEVEEYKSFFNESKVKKLRRHRKWEDEKKIVESIDMQELEREMEINQRKRAKQFADFISNIEDKYTKRKSITSGSSKSSPRGMKRRRSDKK